MCTPKEHYAKISRRATAELNAVLIKHQGPTAKEVEDAYAKYYRTLANASQQAKGVGQ